MADLTRTFPQVLEWWPLSQFGMKIVNVCSLHLETPADMDNRMVT
jgi:hypothetical protein